MSHRVSVEVHDHDASGARRDRLRHPLGVHVPRARLGVDEHRLRAAVDHRVGGRDVGEGRHDHLVARPHSVRQQREVHGDRPVAAGDRVAHTAELREGSDSKRARYLPLEEIQVESTQSSTYSRSRPTSAGAATGMRRSRHLSHRAPGA